MFDIILKLDCEKNELKIMKAINIELNILKKLKFLSIKFTKRLIKINKIKTEQCGIQG